MKRLLKDGLDGLVVALPSVVVAAIAAIAAAQLFDRVDGVEYQQPGIAFTPSSVNATPKTAPSSGSGGYFGMGAPYLVVTYRDDNGSLEGILHYAEARPKSTVGFDACNSKFIFDKFYIAEPTGGAGPDSTVVTYASESYESPLTPNLPGYDKCATRFGIEATYEVYLCAERDGSIDPVDVWDFCITFEHHSSIR